MRSLCGQPEGPIQLLALEDHEQLAGVFRAEDHWLAWVDVYDGSVVSSPTETMPAGTGGTIPDASAGPFVRLLAHELRVLDACGDDARTVIDQVTTLAQHGDRWFACDIPEGLMWFDPAGRRPPQRVASCSRYTVVDTDLVVEVREPEGAVGKLVRLSLAEGREPEPVWTVDGTWVRSWAPPDRPRLMARYGASVLEIDPDTGTTETLVELEPLEDAFVYDGRFVAIETEGAPDYRIWDRVTDETVAVPLPPPAPHARGGLDWTYAKPGLLAIGRYDAPVVVWLPELEVVPLPEGAVVRGRLGDTLVVGVSSRIDVIDGPGADPRTVATDLGGVYAVQTQGIVAEHRGDLVSIPFDGSGPTTLAHDVHDPRALTADRWASLDGIGGVDGALTLVVLDPDGDRRGIIDDGVSDLPWPDYARDALAPADDVVYRVEAPDRRGLWYAELP